MSSSADLLRETQPTGYFVQLWVTIVRVLIQQLRSPVSLLVEILLPVAIVAGLAALSSTSPTLVNEGQNYVPARSAPVPAISLGMQLPALICYNDGFRPAGYTGAAAAAGVTPATSATAGELASDGYARKMLLPCSAFYGNATHPRTGQPLAATASTTTPWVCSDDLPRDFVAPRGLCGFRREDQPLVAATSLVTSINAIPPVDDMLLAQWAARTIQPYEMPDFLQGPDLRNSIKISGAVYVAASGAAAEAGATRLVAELNHSSSLFRNFAYRGMVKSLAALAPVFGDFSREGSTWAVLTVRKFGGPNEPAAERGLDVTLHLNRSSSGWTVRARQRLYSGGPRTEPQLLLASGFLSLERAVGAAYADYIGGTGAAAPPAATPAPTAATTTTTAAPNATTVTLNASFSGPSPAAASDDRWLAGGAVSAFMLSDALTPAGDDIGIAPMPFPEYRITRFLQIAGGLMPLLVSLALLYSVSQLVKHIVEEKEKKLRAGMQAMGLRGSVPPTAFLLVFIVQGVITAAFQTMILSLSFMPESDASIIFVVFMLFAISSSCFSVLMSCFFSKARISGIVAPIVFLMCAIPSVAIPQDSAPRANRLLSFLSPSAFSLAVRLLLQYEQTTGMGWNDAASSLDEVPLAFVIFMMIFDCFLYFFLALYLDNVMKNEHGVSRSCCYCCSADECCCSCGGAAGTPAGALETRRAFQQNMYVDDPIGGDKLLRTLASAYPDEGHVEAHKRGDEPYISICGLTKVYESADGGPGKVAVDNLTLHLMRGHISVLLGGNGCGKSSLIGCITGMQPITEGDVLVAGYSVRHQLATTQQLVAVCPQHNLLWPELSCMQHLLFYAQIKGLPRDVAELRGLELLRRLELFDKRDQNAGQLSGGQKRKLSVAIAFVAGSPFVILDEPTAGMDVPARRATWKLLQHMTKSRSLATAEHPVPGEPAHFATAGCSILLVTHFLDEADLLGDRIAIASAGQLHSYGTPEFLKSRLGRGYVLRFTTHTALAPAQTQALVADINGAAFGVQGATLNEAKGQEVTVRLPNSQVPRIPGLLRRFGDTTSDIARKYQVEALSIEVSTMEDVFQHIADDEGARAAKLEVLRESKAGGGAVPASVGGNGNSTADSLLGGTNSPTASYGGDGAAPGHEHQQGLPDKIKKALDICFDAHRAGKEHRPGGSFGTQFVALSLKRMHYLRRDRRTICFQLVVPLLCVILAMLLTNISPPTSTELTFNKMYDPEKQQIPYTESPCAASSNGVAPASGLAFPFAAATNTANLSSSLLATFKQHGEAERNTAWSCGDAQVLTPDFVTSSACHPSRYPAAAASGNLSALVLNPACRRATSVIFGNFSTAFGQAYGLANWIGAHVRRIAVNKSLAAGVDAVSLATLPLPFSAREQSNLDTISLIIGALFVTLPFCFVPSTFVSFIVREAETRAKMLQRVSGVNIGAFWLSHSVFDITTYLLTELLTLIIFAISNHQEYVGPKAIGVMLTLFVLNAIATTGAGYCVSFLFESHANAQTWVMLLGFLSGFVMVIFGVVLEDLGYKWVLWIFRCFPTYCFGEVLISVALGPQRELGGADAQRWAMEESGEGLLLLGIQSVIFFVIVFIVEFRSVWLPAVKGCCSSGGGGKEAAVKPNPAPPDAKEPWDVREERQRTEAPLPPGVDAPPLRVLGLRKVYENVKLEDNDNSGGGGGGGNGAPKIVPKTEKGTLGRTNIVAVQNLSFTVARGEILGLLGLNGGGKSSALYAVTGELAASAGDAVVDGKSITTQENEARTRIGYVPQFDALFDMLTVREHLALYAALRGVDPAATQTVIDGLIAACDLSKYRDVVSAGLSGGNKRKLSVAIGLVGGPSLLLLDEPSAGIDPAARRVLWDVFMYVSQFCGTVLVGHHLEEIEALAHRVAIMAAGKFHCIGPLGRIKSAVGGGVETRIRANNADEIDFVYSRLRDAVTKHAALHSSNGNNGASSPLTAATLLEEVEKVEGRLTLRLPSAAAARANLSPANLFEWLLDLQQQQHFEFSVSNATIEQVFLAVAQQQELADGPDGHDAAGVASPTTIIAHATASATPAAYKQLPPAFGEDDDDFLQPAPRAPNLPAPLPAATAQSTSTTPPPAYMSPTTSASGGAPPQGYGEFDDLL